VARWEEIVQKMVQQGQSGGLSPDFMRGVLHLIHAEAIRRQAEVMNQPAVPAGPTA
jgi:chorismate mutase